MGDFIAGLVIGAVAIILIMWGTDSLPPQVKNQMKVWYQEKVANEGLGTYVVDQKTGKVTFVLQCQKCKGQ